jgi:tetratricopeptide (TPR) repeat protein
MHAMQELAASRDSEYQPKSAAAAVMRLIEPHGASGPGGLADQKETQCRFPAARGLGRAAMRRSVGAETSVTGNCRAEHYRESREVTESGSDVMKRRLGVYRVFALALVIAVTGIGCVTAVPAARSKLDVRQTMIMVRAGEFAALNRYYAAVQAGYDKGSVSDESLRSAFRNFYDSSPDLAGQYQSWVKEMPGSYVAHLARAIYYIRVGKASRGERFIADTSDAQMNGMDVAFATASKELQASLPLDSRPLMSVFYQIDIGMYYGDAAANRRLFQAALKIDPKNYIAREMYIQTLTTAWGGSTQDIRAFVAESETAGLSASQMNDLRGVEFSDEAWVDRFDNKNYERAASEYLEAARLTGDDTCVLCAGKMLVLANDFPAAARVLTQYLNRHPESADALTLRAWAYSKLGQMVESVRDYKRAAELGDAYSEDTLGMMYLVGEFGLPKDRGAAILLLRHAAAQGNPDAMRMLPIALNPRSVFLAAPPPRGSTRSPTS